MVVVVDIYVTDSRRTSPEFVKQAIFIPLRSLASLS